MKEAMLYERLEDSKVRCRVCAHECEVAEGRFGVCRTRRNVGGRLFTLIYGRVSSEHADPIEKKPLYHFYPGSYVYSLGTISCNFKCLHCQNFTISKLTAEDVEARRYTFELSPAEAVRRAVATGCRGIAWTYNEPTIWFEYTYDCAQAAKREGLYTVYVTNGYMSEEALEKISPFLDAANVDVKAFSNDFYRKICGARLEPVLETCERMHKKGIHIELTYLVIPRHNDDDEQFSDFAAWVVSLDASIPVHFSRFYPCYKLLDVPPTGVVTLERAHDIAKRKGVEFVYLGNVPGHDYENTYCPDCGTLLVERYGYNTRVKFDIEGGKAKCPECGREIKMVLG